VARQRLDNAVTTRDGLQQNRCCPRTAYRIEAQPAQRALGCEHPHIARLAALLEARIELRPPRGGCAGGAARSDPEEALRTSDTNLAAAEMLTGSLG
jgi:hypothetical protein